MRSRIFGEIPGIPPGSIFSSRAALSVAGVHRPRQAGISGGAEEGADSIVLSGGYEDDVDLGDVIIYTGHGGNDARTGRQIADQQLTRQNLALAKRCIEGLPVRVVRGAHSGSHYGPPAGYRYDGLYRVESYWQEQGQSGFRIWRYRFVRDTPTNPSTSRVEPHAIPADRRAMTVQRLVRNSAAAQYVKYLYDHTCQLCQERLETPAGPYCEAAHIRPLGRPHDDPDTIENILCLCPNHHVLFDYGSLVIDDDMRVFASTTGQDVGRLKPHPNHLVDRGHLTYHRRLFLVTSTATEV